MEFNDKGLMEPGFHRICLKDVEQQFVLDFPTSITRKRNFSNFLKWLNSICKEYPIYEIWIDGSFVTNKINPNDIDVVIFFMPKEYLKIASKWNIIREYDYIDAYLAMAICDESKKIFYDQGYFQEYSQMVNNRNYWRGQFGFDRSDNPKGLLVVDGKEVDGGDSSVN